MRRPHHRKASSEVKNFTECLKILRFTKLGRFLMFRGLSTSGEDNQDKREEEDSGTRDEGSQPIPNMTQLVVPPHDINPPIISRQDFFIDYTFNGNTGDGVLINCGTEVTVYPSQLSFPVRIFHPNLLKVLFTHNGNVICERQGGNFDGWLKSLDPEKSLIEEYTAAGLCSTSITMECKRVFLSLLLVVDHIHKAGFSIRSLGRENICFKENQLKLFKLELVAKTNRRAKNTFRGIEKVFREILGTSKLSPPPDMIHLLDLLSDIEGAEEAIDHVALMDSRERMSLVCDFYENPLYRGGGDYNLSWRKACSTFFREFDLNGWDTGTFASKIVGPFKSVLKVNVDGVSYNTRVVKGSSQLAVAQGFLNFLRNLTHHLGHHENNGRCFPRDQVDSFVFWAFGVQIITFRKILKAQIKFDESDQVQV